MRNWCLAVASPAEKFCKIKIELVKMETFSWKLQKNVMANTKLQWALE